MALLRLGDVGVQQAYNTETGAMHMVRVTGVGASEAVEDLGAVATAVATGDIEIGAVELKDAGTVLRANVRQADAAVPGDDGLVVADPNALVALNSLLAQLLPLTTTPVEKTPVKVVQAVAVPSTAEALVGSETFAREVHLQAKKVAGDNTGNVFVGLSDLDQAAAELFELTPGQSMSIVMPPGTMVNVADIYVDADTADDGVVGWYIPV